MVRNEQVEPTITLDDPGDERSNLFRIREIGRERPTAMGRGGNFPISRSQPGHERSAETACRASHHRHPSAGHWMTTPPFGE